MRWVESGGYHVHSLWLLSDEASTVYSRLGILESDVSCLAYQLIAGNW